MKGSIICLLFVLLLAACDAPQMPLPGVTGKAGELVVVMDETYWKSQAGDTAFHFLAQDVYGLPQPEPMFNVVHIPNAAFTKIFQTHRNIVLSHIGPEQKPHIELRSDVWATPQIVVEISAPNTESFLNIFSENQARIIDHILKKEQDRILTSYNAQLNDEVVAHLVATHSLKLSIPKGYNVVRSADDLTWIRYETKDVTQSILVYTEPYTRPNTFTKEGMIEVMDLFSKKYVPGPDDGTYMKTFAEYPPVFIETSMGVDYAASLKGLWNVENALMGGPFVCYALLSRDQKTVVYLHGFVFAPGKNKRNYLRQVESIIRSLELR